MVSCSWSQLHIGVLALSASAGRFLSVTKRQSLNSAVTQVKNNVSCRLCGLYNIVSAVCAAQISSFSCFVF